MRDANFLGTPLAQAVPVFANRHRHTCRTVSPQDRSRPTLNPRVGVMITRQAEWPAMVAAMLAVAGAISSARAGWLDFLKKEAPAATATALSTDEIAGGLKEALAKGTETRVWGSYEKVTVVRRATAEEGKG